MSVCLLATIGFEGDDIVYDGPAGAHWRLPIAAVRLIGVLAAGDAHEVYLAFVTDPDVAWFQAERFAVGGEQLLAQLSERINGGVPLEPPSEVGRSGCVLWPAKVAGEPLFGPHGGIRCPG